MNKTKVFELKIEDDDELSGIDSISLVDEPAIEVNWIAFKKEKQQEFHIPEGQDEIYLEKLMKYGQPEEELLDNGWVIQKENFVTSSPNSESVEDTSKYLIRYKYIKNPQAPGAAVKETTREFCKVLLNKNFVYRVEDLLNIINDEGSNAADWRGGYNCRHIWQQITYYNDGNKIVNKGSVTKNRVDGMESLDVFGDPQNDTRTKNPSFSKEKFESYSDYPDSVKNNAKAVLKYVDENGWGACGTPVGKQRANQLAKGEAISKDTIQRMYSYLSRHAGDLDSSKGYGDGCGKLMYDSWGGKSALSWAESKVKQFNKEKFQEACPPATQDVATNLKNRQNAINVAHYGPLNPNEPNEDYWIAKAKMFGGDVASAKKSRCGNCSFFVQTKSMLDCISNGIGGQDAWSTIDAGDLGYCEAFDFKCAASRTCDAWVVGGPITQEFSDKPKVSIDYDGTLSTDKGQELYKELIDAGNDVYIVTARNEKEGESVLALAKQLRIPQDKVLFTNGGPKSEVLNRIGITKHYDNNPDVIAEIKKNAPSVDAIKFGYDVGGLPDYIDPAIKKKPIPKSINASSNYLDQFEYLHKTEMKKQHFQTDDDKHIVLGPAMIPDQRIFRKDDKGEPYYVFFSPETIKMIAEKYMRNKYTDNNDLMHDGQAVKDIHVLESWIVEDPEHDKAKKYGFDVPSGTWMISMKVNNPNVWEQIKEKKLNGFSVSGFFEEVAAFCREEMFLKQVVEILKNIKD